jgi:hypothetical protein
MMSIIQWISKDMKGNRLAHSGGNDKNYEKLLRISLTPILFQTKYLMNKILERYCWTSLNSHVDPKTSAVQLIVPGQLH